MILSVTAGMTILLGLFYSWTSRINGLFFFGRTVSPELQASGEARAITREYQVGIIVATILVVTIVCASSRAGSPALAMAGMFLECVAFSFLFARANGKVRDLLRVHTEWLAGSGSVRQVGLLEQPSYWVPGVAATLLPVAVGAVALAIAIIGSAHSTAVAVGWAAVMAGVERSNLSGILGLACGIMTAGVIQLLAFRSSARLRTRMAQYTVRACISLEWVAAALLIAVLASAHFGLVFSRVETKGIMLVAVAAAFVTLAWNQSRSKRFVPPPVELGADDRWRWGLFYVDRNDPALFVQSRCGAGYTLNYGRVAAWPISLCLVAYLVSMLFFLPPHR